MKCVDASMAAKWLFDEEYSPNAVALRDAASNGAEALFGPPNMPAEITNVIRQRMRREGLSLAAARDRLQLFFRSRVLFIELPEMYEHALELAERYGIDAAYDAIYLAQAQMLGVELWTDDRRLLRTLRGRLSFVRWIADYPVA